MTHTVWCQWKDISIPQGWQITNGDLDVLSSEEFAKISIYVPKYMGGLKALSYIEKMPNLNIVQLLMAGFEDAIPFMNEGQTLCSARGVHDFSTSELVISMLLAHFKNHKEFAANQSQGIWNHKTTGSLFGKKLAIIGAGSIATKLAGMLQTFETQVHLYGSYARNSIENISELPEFAHTFDCIVVLVPLTNKTRNLIDKSILEKMKAGSLLVNVARGPVVNTNDLVSELKKGRIFAAVDVTDPEPLPLGHELWSLPNCQITPHVGGDSQAFEPQARKFLQTQFHRMHQGLPLRGQIDWKNS